MESIVVAPQQCLIVLIITRPEGSRKPLSCPEYLLNFLEKLSPQSYVNGTSNSVFTCAFITSSTSQFIELFNMNDDEYLKWYNLTNVSKFVQLENFYDIILIIPSYFRSLFQMAHIQFLLSLKIETSQSFVFDNFGKIIEQTTTLAIENNDNNQESLINQKSETEISECIKFITNKPIKKSKYFGAIKFKKIIRKNKAILTKLFLLKDGQDSIIKICDVKVNKCNDFLKNKYLN